MLHNLGLKRGQSKLEILKPEIKVWKAVNTAIKTQNQERAQYKYKTCLIMEDQALQSESLHIANSHELPINFRSLEQEP